MNQESEKALSARGPIEIYRTLICLKESSLEDKEACIVNDISPFCKNLIPGLTKKICFKNKNASNDRFR